MALKVELKNLGPKRDYRDELTVTHNDVIVAKKLDGGEYEDNYFSGDWSWVPSLIEKAYELGKMDAHEVTGR
ncbi:MAG: hypothetical protein ACYTE8_00365 [Planctomycetota bacterium]|jgi:hypothetical protein